MLKNKNSSKDNSSISKIYTKSKVQQKSKKKVSLDIDTYQKNAPFYILETIIISLQLAPIYFRQHIISQNQKFLKYPFFNLIAENAINNEDYNLRGVVLNLIIIFNYF